MSDASILFIVEGEKRDYRFVEEMKNCFLQGKHQITVINVPASQNIYMLYKQLQEDEFDTDVVELLRESVPSARERLKGISRRSISQVYMFFDFDPHHNNLKDEDIDTFEIIDKMLEVFSNETEHGKLYISYPMVEALYDYKRDWCQAFSGCFISKDDIVNYKQLSGDGNINANVRFSHSYWKDVIDSFALRVKCLLDIDDMSFDTYRVRVSPVTIFNAQRKIYYSHNSVFVLSAFPEFLLDYFGCNFWKSHVRKTRFSFETCAKGR